MRSRPIGISTLVVDHDEVFRVCLVILHDLADAVTGEVHIGLGFHKQHFLAGNSAFPDQRFMFYFIDLDPVLISQEIQRDKSDVMRSYSRNFFPRIPKAYDDIHIPSYERYFPNQTVC